MNDITTTSVSDTTDATASADGVADAFLSATADEDNQSTTPAAVEELFEVQAGKDNEGKPILKKFNKADLLKHAGLGLTAHERFEEAKKLRGNMEALAKAMKDPEKIWEVLKGLGHNVDDVLQKRLEKAIAEASEDPKDRDLRITKAELERFTKAEAARVKAKEEAETVEATERFTTQLTEKVSGALKAAKLPDTKTNRAEVARVIEQLWNSKDAQGKALFDDPFKIPDDKVVAYIKNSRVGGLNTLLEGADDESLLSLLPEDLVERITKAVSKKMQKAQGVVDNTVAVDTTRREEPTNKNKVKTTAERDAALAETIRLSQIAWEKRQGKR